MIIHVGCGSYNERQTIFLYVSNVTAGKICHIFQENRYERFVLVEMIIEGDYTSSTMAFKKIKYDCSNSQTEQI